MREKLGETFNVKNVKSKQIVDNDFIVLTGVLLVCLSDVKEGYLDDMKKKGYEKGKADQF